MSDDSENAIGRCYVEKIGKGHWRTTVAVPPQYFTIAEADDDSEAREHCEGMRDNFIHAMERIGVHFESEKL